MDWFNRLFRRRVSNELHNTAASSQTASPQRQHHHRYLFDDESVLIAAIGDLHGRLDLLRQVTARLDKIANAGSKRLVEVYLGDYVDRAGDPKAVIDFLIERSTLTDRTVVCLAGNHEQMLLAALQNDKDFLSWLSCGGQPTLLSYGMSPLDAKRQPSATRAAFRAALPQAHLDFLTNLGLSYRHGDFYFVHAGVRPGIPLHEQAPQDLLWIRNEFLSSSNNFGAVVVHGHTPVNSPVFRANRISIDTGAYGSGVLTCLTIASEGVSSFDTSRHEHAWSHEA